MIETWPGPAGPFVKSKLVQVPAVGERGESIADNSDRGGRWTGSLAQKFQTTNEKIVSHVSNTCFDPFFSGIPDPAIDNLRTRTYAKKQAHVQATCTVAAVGMILSMIRDDRKVPE